MWTTAINLGIWALKAVGPFLIKWAFDKFGKAADTVTGNKESEKYYKILKCKAPNIPEKPCDLIIKNPYDPKG